MVTIVLVPGIGHMVGELVEDKPAHLRLRCPGVLVMGEQIGIGQLVNSLYANPVGADTGVNVPRSMVLYCGGATAPMVALYEQYVAFLQRQAQGQQVAGIVDAGICPVDG